MTNCIIIGLGTALIFGGWDFAEISRFWTHSA